ncbi:MAG: hypothetical protein HY266_07600 [Deltaproteobacteria bacterium]|nr:hypothetical protein [Deltaproteobacteria bacterium]
MGRSPAGMVRLASSKNMEQTIPQMNLFGEKDLLKEELRKIDVNSLTPVEALVKLSQLKEMAGE